MAGDAWLLRTSVRPRWMNGSGPPWRSAGTVHARYERTTIAVTAQPDQTRHQVRAAATARPAASRRLEMVSMAAWPQETVHARPRSAGCGRAPLYAAEPVLS